MSEPILTYEAAEAWAYAHGLAIDLSVHRDPKTSATPFDLESAFVALTENLRQQVESAEPAAASDCPPAQIPQTRKAIASELRAIVDKLEAIRGGCVSIADHGAARVVFSAQQNLSSVAGSMVGGERT